MMCVHPNSWNLAGNNTSRDSINYKTQAKKGLPHISTGTLLDIKCSS